MNGLHISIEVVQFTDWFYLFYFISLNSVYIMLNIICGFTLRKYLPSLVLENFPQIFSGLEPPISIIAPAFNEGATIMSSFYSLLHLNYPQFEILIINDGSTDDSIEILKKQLGLIAFPEAYRRRLVTQPINEIYRSSKYPTVRVVDKINGGKADAINMGINLARYPLFCVVDADSILQKDSLRRIVQPFLEDQRIVAAGGTIRVANGCEVSGGFLKKIGLPTKVLALLQVVEYLRDFLMGRIGWASIDALLIISGAFGMFRKEIVIEAGGFKSDSMGEDMELIVRMHRILREQNKDYRIAFLPDPVAWTEVPEDFRTLMNQRIRWQQGLAESLFKNLGLMFSRHPSFVGWLAFPFMLIFELFGPVIEVTGYVLMIVFYITGYISWEVFVVFLFASIGLGLLLTLSSLLLEEMSFHIYDKPKQLAWIMFGVVLESLLYKQINSIWRLIGLLRWLTGNKGKWGTMRRVGDWHNQVHIVK